MGNLLAGRLRSDWTTTVNFGGESEYFTDMSPVVVLPQTPTEKLQHTISNDYCFVWSEGVLALAMGFGSLYNHSEKPNAHFSSNEADQLISVFAVRDISAGTEISIN
jgi:hypothetical protein